ncbi:MAG: hypothetical protein ACJA01_003611, partial [Saprospiraceae bacterium]
MTIPILHISMPKIPFRIFVVLKCVKFDGGVQ